MKAELLPVENPSDIPLMELPLFAFGELIASSSVQSDWEIGDVIFAMTRGHFVNLNRTTWSDSPVYYRVRPLSEGERIHLTI
jgi:hypothetical protein